MLAEEVGDARFDVRTERSNWLHYLELPVQAERLDRVPRHAAAPFRGENGEAGQPRRVAHRRRAPVVRRGAGVVGGQPLDIEDSAAMAIRFDNDTFASVNSGYYLDRGKQSMIKIWGSMGWLQLGLIRGEEPLVWYENGSDGPQSYEEPEGVGGYTPFVRAAVRSVAGLEEPPISSQESLHVLQTIHAFYRSAETGQVQNVG